MLEKKYDHKLVEESKYSKWLEAGYFKSGVRGSEPFCIVIPPPNVTGRLHLGHAWDTTLQDIIIRYKRMDGFDALWVPGMDHAGIATQAKVDGKLREEGLEPRSMDREDWLKHAWSWKEEYAKNIREQWGVMGHSLDYSKERFTLDEGLSKAVSTIFMKLYERGLIYRGERIINWDPAAKTALSNEEVIYKEVKGNLYHIKYYFENSDEYITIATTRPETIFGDVGVAVNPDDERYKNIVGKKVLVPFINRVVPIVADDYVEADFGTGMLKVTPAHDQNDFEVGRRHNLENLLCINDDGAMNDLAADFSGMDRFECREKLVEMIKDKHLEKIEEITHSIGHSERSNAIVEPFLSKQWFVKMDHLAQQVLDFQNTEDKVNFVPKRFEKTLTQWMENVHDWCISRQLWWGHRIPAWYKGDDVVVSVECPGEGYVQDEDVLDTWFSSALWPYSTLGWPDNLDEKYFPNNCLVTGYDIIFFWVSRMIFTSLEFTEKKPFNDVLIHGLIRDKQGRKMSKSLGNGVDPMDVIEEYGTDSLRFFLATSSAPGQDLRYDEEKVAATWNFINKIWNASRFVLLEESEEKELSISDKWILHKMNLTIEKVRKHMEKYEFNIVGTELNNFIWNDFCDWYIELSKVERNNKILRLVLTNILKMLHPFMPYVTEEIYQKLDSDTESIMISEYPKKTKEFAFPKEYLELEEIKDVIVKIRNIKSELEIPKGFGIINNLENSEIINKNKEIFEKLLKCEIVNESNLDKCEVTFGRGSVVVCYEAEEDNNKIEKLVQEKEKLEQSISKREKLLANEKYVANAPKEIVEMDREKLKIEKQKLADIIKEIK